MPRTLAQWKEIFTVWKLGAEAGKAVLIDITILIGIIGACLQGGDLALKKLDITNSGIKMSYEVPVPKVMSRAAIVKGTTVTKPTPLQMVTSPKSNIEIHRRNWIFGFMMVGLLGLLMKKFKRELK